MPIRYYTFHDFSIYRMKEYVEIVESNENNPVVIVEYPLLQETKFHSDITNPNFILDDGEHIMICMEDPPYIWSGQSSLHQFLELSNIQLNENIIIITSKKCVSQRKEHDLKTTFIMLMVMMWLHTFGLVPFILLHFLSIVMAVQSYKKLPWKSRYYISELPKFQHYRR